jgi:predicted nucleic acid-binding protein
VAEAVVLDAGILVKVYVPEELSEEAGALLDRLLDRGAELVEPSFMPVEVLSVLRRKVKAGVLLAPEAEVALASLFALPLEVVDGREVYEHAWRLATTADLPVLYDAVYLAVAEQHGATLWTADEALCRTAAALDLGFVRLLQPRSSTR